MIVPFLISVGKIKATPELIAAMEKRLDAMKKLVEVMEKLPPKEFDNIIHKIIPCL